MFDLKLDFKPIHTDGLDQALRDEIGGNYAGMSINEEIKEFILHFKEQPTMNEVAHALGVVQDHDEAASRQTHAPKMLTAAEMMAMLKEEKRRELLNKKEQR